MDNAKESQPTKPRFFDLCKHYQFNHQRLQEIAKDAHVSYSIAYRMFINKPVARTDAEKVLAAFSELTGKTFTLATVTVPVLVHEMQAHKSEVAHILAEIQEEYDSARQGLSGLAQGTSQHLFITRKMENIGKLHQNLGTIVGNDEAMALICQQLAEESDDTAHAP